MISSLVEMYNFLGGFLISLLHFKRYEKIEDIENINSISESLIIDLLNVATEYINEIMANKEQIYQNNWIKELVNQLFKFMCLIIDYKLFNKSDWLLELTKKLIIFGVDHPKYQITSSIENNLLDIYTNSTNMAYKLLKRFQIIKSTSKVITQDMEDSFNSIFQTLINQFENMKLLINSPAHFLFIISYFNLLSEILCLYENCNLLTKIMEKSTKVESIVHNTVCHITKFLVDCLAQVSTINSDKLSYYNYSIYECLIYFLDDINNKELISPALASQVLTYFLLYKCDLQPTSSQIIAINSESLTQLGNLLRKQACVQIIIKTQIFQNLLEYYSEDISNHKVICGKISIFLMSSLFFKNFLTDHSFSFIKLFKENFNPNKTQNECLQIKLLKLILVTTSSRNNLNLLNKTEVRDILELYFQNRENQTESGKIFEELRDKFEGELKGTENRQKIGEQFTAVTNCNCFELTSFLEGIEEAN